MSKIKTPSFELAVYQRGDVYAKKLAIVLPGLLDPKSYPHMQAHVDFLADHGFLALSFDPPGTWESSGSISDYTMTNYLYAVDEIITYFGDKPTLTLGHSLGGTIAMHAAIQNAHIQAFVAIMSPPTLTAARAVNKKKVSQWEAEGVRVSYRAIHQGQPEEKRFDLPYSFLEDARKYDALEDLGKLTKPKLFISGDEDASVQPELVEEEFSVSADPKDMYVMHSDHDYRHREKLIDEANQRVALFIEKYDL